MHPFYPVQHRPRYGPALIGTGLIIVLTALWYGSIPVASAMALVGWGVLLTLFTQSNHQGLVLMNLVIYAVLVGFTVASQSHAAQQSPLGRLDSVTLADHLLAVALLIALVEYTLRRTITCTESD